MFILAHPQARRLALNSVGIAPEGYAVTIAPPKRNLEQNALLWVLLSAFADQLVWPVNGAMVKLTAEEWKHILSAAFKRESQRVAMGLDGGMVMLGMRRLDAGPRERSRLPPEEVRHPQRWLRSGIQASPRDAEGLRP